MKEMRKTRRRSLARKLGAERRLGWDVLQTETNTIQLLNDVAGIGTGLYATVSLDL